MSFPALVDVIVTDGFTGNVMLKLSEGLTECDVIDDQARANSLSGNKSGSGTRQNLRFVISRSGLTIQSMAARPFSESER